MYNRREFIQKVFRTTSLLSLAAISGYLIFGRSEEEVCDYSFACQNCQKLKKCQLPEAQTYLGEKAHE